MKKHAFLVTTIASVLTHIGSLKCCLADPREDCFKKANQAFGVHQDQAAEVCAGAESDAPAQCFVNAINIQSISPEVAAELCKNALNTNPSECFRRATFVNSISQKSALSLCKPSQSSFQDGFLFQPRPTPVKTPNRRFP